MEILKFLHVDGNMMGKIKTLLFRYRWVAGFIGVIFLAIAVRYPLLPDGHMDEAHTIGRALNIIYTGDLNPHFFNHPTGTMYLMILPDLLSIAMLSREAGGNPRTGDYQPLERFMVKYMNPVQNALYKESKIEPLWDAFRYRVRWFNLMFIPLQIVLLAYIGIRLHLLAPALAAGVLLAFCPANIRDSVYVSVNSSTGFFTVLSLAVTTYFICKPTAKSVRQWLFRLGVISFVVGLAVACKFNAGVFLIVPFIYGVMSVKDLPQGKERILEKMAASLPVILLSMSAGFTLLCPYWYKELKLFIQHVMFQIWYFQVGHEPYNTFEPGLQMGWQNLRCIADQYGWFGLVVTTVSIGYLLKNKAYKKDEYRRFFLLWIPTLAGSLAFYVLMSRQAVFFARNFSIMWAAWFFCSAVAWWLAAKIFAEKRGYSNVHLVQTLFLFGVLLVSVLEATVIGPLLFQETREWWRRGDEIIIAIKYWF